VSPMSSSRDQLIKAFETLDVDGSGACVAKQLRTWAHRILAHLTVASPNRALAGSLPRNLSPSSPGREADHPCP